MFRKPLAAATTALVAAIFAFGAVAAPAFAGNRDLIVVLQVARHNRPKHPDLPYFGMIFSWPIPDVLSGNHRTTVAQARASRANARVAPGSGRPRPRLPLADRVPARPGRNRPLAGAWAILALAERSGGELPWDRLTGPAAGRSTAS